MCAGRKEGWGSEKASPSVLAPLDVGSLLCSPKGSPLIHCEELGNGLFHLWASVWLK